MGSSMQELRQLDLTAIGEIDGGRIKLAFQQALDRVLADLDDRPGEKKPRVIQLSAAFVPVMDGTVCDNAKVQVVVHDSIPKRSSKVYDMSLQKRAGKVSLLFRPDSLDDADQGAFDFDAEK